MINEWILFVLSYKAIVILTQDVWISHWKYSFYYHTAIRFSNRIICRNDDRMSSHVTPKKGMRVTTLLTIVRQSTMNYVIESVLTDPDLHEWKHVKTCTSHPFLNHFIIWFVTSVGQRKKFWVPMRNRTSALRISRSDALPLSNSNCGERGLLRSLYDTRPTNCQDQQCR